MISTSEDDDENEQAAVTSNNSYLRKCLLCNIEVKLDCEKK